MDTKRKMLFALSGVTNNAGQSTEANVNVSPTSVTMHTGEHLTLTAHAVNSLVIIWQEKLAGTWTTITGITGETFTREYPHQAGVPGSFNFRAVAYGWYNTAVSNEVPVTVSFAPTSVIVTASAQTVSIPGTVTLSATGDYIDSLEWFESSDDGETWVSIGTAAELSKSFSEGDEGIHLFKCEATGLSGTVTSEALSVEALLPNDE